MLQRLARGSRHGALGLLASLVVMTLLVPPVAGQATRQLDQQQTATNGGPISCLGAGVALGQTFTAGLTGALDQVDLMVGTPASQTVTVQIRNTVGGLPGSTVLASTTFTFPTTVPPTAFSSVPFSAPAPVVAGTQYAVVFDCSAGGVVVAAASITDPYPPGAFVASLTGLNGPYTLIFGP